ncbi:MAG: phosphoribosylformylglycinamidine cyclo-ligase [Actinomycetota bacterium]
MSGAYRAAGVDTGAAAKAVGLIAELAASTRRPEVADTLGGFAGLFDIGGGKLLAAATDGVGTKLELARLTGRRRTVGIDLVAMCVDDIVCVGAEPLFFLDYLAVGRVVPEQVAELVEGVAEGCRRAGCALLGGETAEHPGTMPEDQFDLAGFCVGVVQDTALLGPHRVREGDVLVGLASSGLHANGYSLVRRALLDGRPLDAVVPELGRPLADELLEPCTIHAPVVLDLHRRGLLHAAAHVTGGGLAENVPRMLPEGLGARLDRGTWTEPAIFGLLQREADLSDADLFATFNMGLGMLLAVAPEHADAVAAHGPVVGLVEAGAGVRVV